MKLPRLKQGVTVGAQVLRELRRRQLLALARTWILTNPAAAASIRAESAWLIGNAVGKFYGDNSAALHQHLLKDQPQLAVYWVIDPDSPDVETARALGPVLFTDDVMTYVRALLARVHVISHGVHDVPGCGYLGAGEGPLKVRLGHGLTALKKTKPRLGHTVDSANAVFDLVPVCSEFERSHKLEWGIAPERLVVTGIPRFDTLLAKQRAYPTDSRRLLYMPTWRDAVASASEWEATPFYLGVTGFLCDARLHRVLNEQGATLDVFLHMNLQPHVRGLDQRLEGTPVRLIKVADPQRAFAEAGLLITDYSSVAWDVLYLDKPVVFYHFDLEEHAGDRGGHVALDDTLPGPSLRTPDALIDTLEQHLRGTLKTQAGYAERMVRWQQTAFAFRDDRNSARVTSAIMKLLQERNEEAPARPGGESLRMPRRLLFVVTALAWGGAESQVIDLARTLSKQGWQVAVAVLLDHAERRRDLEGEGIAVHTLGMKRGLPDARAVLRLAAVIREFRPSVVHSHMVHANLMTRLTRLVAPSTVLVTSAHNVDEGADWRMWVYRATDRLTNLTTNVSPAAVARSIERGAAPPSRIRCMPNGIDTTRFNPEPELRAHMRRELGLDGRFVWLCVSSLERQKDYPNLFGALERLKDHAARPLVLAVGVGSLQRDLESMASSLAPGKVRFLGARWDVPALMAAADAYVLSSAWEGLPLVLLEASASCLPIVCTDVGGNREIVRDGETGYVVPPESSAMLAEAMARVMDFSAEQRAGIGHQARAHVDATFSLQGVAARWERTYTEIFERVGGQARRLDLPHRV